LFNVTEGVVLPSAPNTVSASGEGLNTFKSLPALRQQVRTFIEEEIAAQRIVPAVDPIPSGYDPSFSRKLGQKGWIGVTWPTRFGGNGWSPQARFCITEELVAAGAPVGAHWIADRQFGPLLLAVGSEQQCEQFLPQIARGELYCSIGMSEPHAGSDLSGITTKATVSETGWRLEGRKIWSSRAHVSQLMLVLCRTEPPQVEDRRLGLSQLIVDLSLPGVTITPIISMDGEHHFNEVQFDGVQLPADALLGTRGEGWKQSSQELASERGGPERILSSFPALALVARRLLDQPEPPAEALEATARCVVRIWGARLLAQETVRRIELGRNVSADAAATKDLGTVLETDIVDEVRRILAYLPAAERAGLADFVNLATLKAPAFTISGGTTEILRSVQARDL